MPREITQSDRRVQIEQWLGATLTKNNYETAKSVRQEGTCNWILDRKQFRNWIAPYSDSDQKARVLWLHGGPGFGKTILAGRLTEYLHSSQESSVAYFFCTSEDEVKRDPYSILKAWMSQLISNDSGALEVAFRFYQDNKRALPGNSDLWDLFAELLKKAQYILIVDGFDECSTINKTSKFHTDDGRSKWLSALLIALQWHTVSCLDGKQRQRRHQDTVQRFQKRFINRCG